MREIHSPRRQSVAVIVLLFAAACGAATAQSLPQRWTTNVVAGEFPSQAAALAAVRAKGGAYALAEVVENVIQGDTKTTFIYGARPKDPTVGEWVYEYYTATEALSVPSEAAAVAASLAGLQSQHPVCGFVSIEPTKNWGTIQSSGLNGMSTYQVRSYEAWGTTPDRCSPWLVSGYRRRVIACPAQLAWSASSNACVRDGIARITATAIPCAPCDLRSNPISVSTGGKYQAETDFELPWLTFRRHYQSTHSISKARLGPNWTHDLAMRVVSDGAGLVQSHGGVLPFRASGPNHDAVDGSDWRISDAAGGGYVLATPDSTVIFDASQRVTRIERLDGSSVTLEYGDFDRLVAAVSKGGARVDFNYQEDVAARAANISSISLGGVSLVTYSYDDSGRLVSAHYPDGTSKEYLYERSDFPSLLTGIRDENGVRFATFAYDASGYAISSEHAGGVSRGTFSYEADGSTIYTDADNQVRRYTFTKDDAYRKISGSSDGNGTETVTFGTSFRRRPATRTDKNGVKTTYSYLTYDDPAFGNVVRTTETQTAGAAVLRTTVTWVQTNGGRLMKRSAPGIEVTYTRNTRGKIVSTQQLDTLTGLVRTSTSTWCEQSDVDAGVCPFEGLILSTNGPRDDVDDSTRYEYYSSDSSGCQPDGSACTWRKGDLWKVINPHGQVTELLRYDGAGRVVSSKDSNGVITDL